MLSILVQYYFIIAILISAILIILSKNPVHAIFFLILVFANSTGLFLFLRIEFLSMLLLIVYMGAISILFLFVVMMLNIKILELESVFWRKNPTSYFIIFILLIQLFIFLFFYFNFENENFLFLKNIETFSQINIDNNSIYLDNNYTDWSKIFFSLNDIQAISSILYTYFSYSFLLISLILLVAMLATITLTLESVLISKKQFIFKQVTANLKDFLKQIKEFNSKST